MWSVGFFWDFLKILVLSEEHNLFTRKHDDCEGWSKRAWVGVETSGTRKRVNAA